MNEEIKRLGGATLKGDEGGLRAVFSVFDVIDSDGDVVRASAFTDGQAVPLVWSHDWDKPVGRGVVQVEKSRAVFDGRFFLETSAGLDAYRTVKAMGDLQEYSWGFRITDATFGEHDGQDVRFIEKAELFEVSPVLVGANRETRTLAIKTQSYADEAGAVHAAVAAFVARSKSLADLRGKEGRGLSAANRERLSALAAALDELHPLREELKALLAATVTNPAAGATPGPLTRGELLAIYARLNGVPV